MVLEPSFMQFAISSAGAAAAETLPEAFEQQRAVLLRSLRLTQIRARKHPPRIRQARFRSATCLSRTDSGFGPVQSARESHTPPNRPRPDRA
jgi:hypothetical protein